MCEIIFIGSSTRNVLQEGVLDLSNLQNSLTNDDCDNLQMQSIDDLLTDSETDSLQIMTAL